MKVMHWKKLEKTAQDNSLYISRHLPCGILLTNQDMTGCYAIDGDVSAPLTVLSGTLTYTVEDAIRLRDALTEILPHVDYEC